MIEAPRRQGVRLGHQEKIRQRRRTRRLRARVGRLLRRSDRESLEARARGLQLEHPPHLTVAEIQALRVRR